MEARYINKDNIFIRTRNGQDYKPLKVSNDKLYGIRFVLKEAEILIPYVHIRMLCHIQEKGELHFALNGGNITIKGRNLDMIFTQFNANKLEAIIEYPLDADMYEGKPSESFIEEIHLDDGVKRVVGWE